MEIFGKIKAIFTAKEGKSALSGNPYQIQNVVMEGTESVVFEVFGTKEHLSNHGMIEGAEGKATIKCKANEWKGKWYQQMRMENVRTEWKIISVAAPVVNTNAVPAAETANQVGASTQASPAQTGNNDELPF